MMLQIYNTQTRVKEEFKPFHPTKVDMYVCGPTVYGLLHVGNFRGPIFFNLVRNWLEYLGYAVKFVYNYTDVDDKIINRANQDGVTSSELANKYVEETVANRSILRKIRFTKDPIGVIFKISVTFEK